MVSMLVEQGKGTGRVRLYCFCRVATEKRGKYLSLGDRGSVIGLLYLVLNLSHLVSVFQQTYRDVL